VLWGNCPENTAGGHGGGGRGLLDLAYESQVSARTTSAPSYARSKIFKRPPSVGEIRMTDLETFHTTGTQLQ
jgi:hypothetical protein